MRAHLKSLSIVGLSFSVVSAGEISFDPPMAVVAPGGTASYVVTITSTDLANFTSFDILFSSDRPDLAVSFEFDAGLDTNLTFGDATPVGAFPSDLYIGAFNFEPWTAPMTLGTLRIDATGLPEGTYDNLIQVRPDAEAMTPFGSISNVSDGAALVPEPLRGAASLLISDPGADTDGDGVPNAQDAFPTDPNETVDTDGDGVGDNADAFPTDPTETTDADGDGIGDNADTNIAGPPSGGTTAMCGAGAPTAAAALLLSLMLVGTTPRARYRAGYGGSVDRRGSSTGPPTVK